MPYRPRTLLPRLLAGVLAACTLLAGCNPDGDRAAAAAAMTGGDPGRGKTALVRYGCTSCHLIPGVRGADALIGPPLSRVASRMYIGGVLENTTDNKIAAIDVRSGHGHRYHQSRRRPPGHCHRTLGGTSAVLSGGDARGKSMADQAVGL